MNNLHFELSRSRTNPNPVRKGRKKLKKRGEEDWRSKTYDIQIVMPVEIRSPGDERIPTQAINPTDKPITKDGGTGEKGRKTY